jgi:hypothetical protein
MRARQLFVSAAVAVSLTSASCRDLDVVTASYATLAEARAAGAIERGWVPDGLPEGTRELREAHDQDSNRRWGLFLFPPDQADALRALLDPREVDVSGWRCDIPGRIEWWPVLLRGRIDAEAARTTRMHAYRDRRSDLVFLVNWEQGRAYYWTIE